MRLLNRELSGSRHDIGANYTNMSIIRSQSGAHMNRKTVSTWNSRMVHIEWSNSGVCTTGTDKTGHRTGLGHTIADRIDRTDTKQRHKTIAAIAVVAIAAAAAAAIATAAAAAAAVVELTLRLILMLELLLIVLLLLVPMMLIAGIVVC